jgi:thymidylate kinase
MMILSKSQKKLRRKRKRKRNDPEQTTKSLIVQPNTQETRISYEDLSKMASERMKQVEKELSSKSIHVHADPYQEIVVDAELMKKAPRTNLRMKSGSRSVVIKKKK